MYPAPTGRGIVLSPACPAPFTRHLNRLEYGHTARIVLVPMMYCNGHNYNTLTLTLTLDSRLELTTAMKTTMESNTAVGKNQLIIIQYNACRSKDSVMTAFLRDLEVLEFDLIVI